MEETKKLCDQKGQEPKGLFRQAKNQPKKILPLVKRTISNVYGRQKKTTKKQQQQQQLSDKFTKALELFLLIANVLQHDITTLIHLLSYLCTFLKTFHVSLNESGRNLQLFCQDLLIFFISSSTLREIANILRNYVYQ